jgi:hypothetical protein
MVIRCCTEETNAAVLRRTHRFYLSIIVCRYVYDSADIIHISDPALYDLCSLGSNSNPTITSALSFFPCTSASSSYSYNVNTPKQSSIPLINAHLTRTCAHKSTCNIHTNPQAKHSRILHTKSKISTIDRQTNKPARLQPSPKSIIATKRREGIRNELKTPRLRR